MACWGSRNKGDKSSGTNDRRLNAWWAQEQASTSPNGGWSGVRQAGAMTWLVRVPHLAVAYACDALLKAAGVAHPVTGSSVLVVCVGCFATAGGT